MPFRIIFALGVFATFFLVYYINSTTPANAGPLGVLLVFILIYIITTVLATLLLLGVNHLIARLFYFDRPDAYKQKMSLKKSYYYGSVLAFAPLILISLQSVGRTSIWGVIAVFVLVILGVIYVSRQFK